MPQFSKRSAEKLAECDHHLQVIFNEVIKHWDCAVICGHRNEAEQQAAFISGHSKVQWPNGKHNTIPSSAVDVLPCLKGYPTYNADICRTFGGFVLGIAAALNLKHRIRWGGDWDGDQDTTDQTFHDLGHFEMK